MAVENIIEEIEKLTVLELAELVSALEDKFGVTAQAAVIAAPAFWIVKERFLPRRVENGGDCNSE